MVQVNKNGHLKFTKRLFKLKLNIGPKSIKTLGGKYFFGVSYFEGYAEDNNDYLKLIEIGKKFEKLGFNAKCLNGENAKFETLYAKLKQLRQLKHSIIVLFFIGEGFKINGKQYEPKNDLDGEVFMLYKGMFLPDNKLRTFLNSLHHSNTLYILVNSCYAEGMIEKGRIKEVSRIKNTCRNISIFNTNEENTSIDTKVLNMLTQLPDKIFKLKPANFRGLWKIVKELDSTLKYSPAELTEQDKLNIKSI